MNNEEKKNTVPEETKTERKPAMEGCVMLSDEEMAQVTGGNTPGFDLKPGFEVSGAQVFLHYAHDNK